MPTEFSLVGSFRISPNWQQQLDASLVTDSVSALVSFSLADGDGPGEADGYWRSLVAVGANAVVSLDLTALPLNVFGTAGTIHLGDQKLLAVRNRSAVSGVLVELGTSVVATLDPAGFLLVSSFKDGWSETTLDLTNATATAVAVEVYIAGVRAT